MKYFLSLTICLSGLTSMGQNFSISSSFSFGTESSNINLKSNRLKNYRNHYKYITNKNSKMAMFEIKYTDPKLRLKSIQLYPLLMTGYASDLFAFNVNDINMPITYDFSEHSFLNGILLGGAFHPKKVKDYNFYVEVGVVNKHFTKTEGKIDVVYSDDIFYQEIHILSKYKNGFGMIYRGGVDLKLNKRNSLSLGLTHITSNKTKIDYAYERIESGGGGQAGVGDNNGYWENKKNKFWCLNIRYQYILSYRNN